MRAGSMRSSGAALRRPRAERSVAVTAVTAVACALAMLRRLLAVAPHALAAALAALGAAASAVAPAAAQQSTAPTTAVLFENVRVFDGKSERLSAPQNVLVVGRLIQRVSAAPIAVDPALQLTTIRGNGRTLMPGLIDAHVHLMFEVPQLVALTADLGYLTLLGARQAEQHLMRGFTTVRDMAGPAFGLARAIDAGLVPGPRVFPSGAMISQTAGHGDFRLPTDTPRDPGAPLTYAERVNAMIVADGADQVLLRAREQLRAGATQIKIAGGGGVASTFDPLDVTQGSEAEFRAAVTAAENWGTYVAVHAYTPRAVQVALRAGVRSIEHGQLIDEATAKLIAEKGAWLSIQPFLADEDANQYTGESRRKQLLVAEGTARAFELAKKYKLKVAFGTDMLNDPRAGSKQGRHLTKFARWFSNAEVLRMATSGNAELLALSGERNPYREGKLGVVEAGAYADLLLVNGDPLANLQLVAEPEKHFDVIMKDGRLYRNR